MIAGTALRIRLGGHLSGRRVKAYFFFEAFFLAFFFAFAMLALQFDGLVRGPSIYTRIEITSERGRCVLGARAHHDARTRATARAARHSSVRMNFQCAASTGVTESRLPGR